MRSLFWRILASFWLAIALVGGLSVLVGHMLNQDAWILNRHPVLNSLPEQWTQRFEEKGADNAQDFLQDIKRRNRIDVQVLSDSGEPMVRGTFPPRWKPDSRPTRIRAANCPGAAWPLNTAARKPVKRTCSSTAFHTRSSTSGIARA
ncbi:Sensor histidine kinase [Pseudomonas meliae]|uniref:Sensor histidine kinase n=1 Tax=Pseudomonas meliae TaxID=86176 RepID=A0A0P9XCU4_9PSED|nr:Sensor histidine kinase [Pseudomonas meliae]